MSVDAVCFVEPLFADRYEKKHWPGRFVGVPHKGDVVFAESGRTLQVLDVFHKVREKQEKWSVDDPYIAVMLGVGERSERADRGKDEPTKLA